MKLSLSLLTIIILFNCFSACSKHDSAPTIPPVLDTLLSWQKIKVSKSFINDVAFLTPAKGFCLDSSSLYNSSDSGKTWTLVPGVTDQFYNLFLLNTQRGVAQGLNSVFVTSDYIHWSAKQLPAMAGNLYYPSIQFTSAATGYASIANNLYKTTDTANTWNSVFSSPVEGMFFFNDNEGIIYTTNTPSPPSNLFHTSDGGAHWQPLSVLPNPFVGYNVLQFTDRMHGWLMIANSIYGTVDGGTTWLDKKDFSGPRPFDAQFVDNQTGYIVQGDEILKTTDGGQTWVRSCKIGNGEILDLFFLDAKTGWAGCTDGSILRLKQ